MQVFVNGFKTQPGIQTAQRVAVTSMVYVKSYGSATKQLVAVFATQEVEVALY